jgi:indole-3-glycerol phosphate synthase
VADLAEADRALASGATLIGINNRNLHDFTVDLGTTDRVAAHLLRSGRAVTLAALSGIKERSEVEHYQQVRPSWARARVCAVR